MRSPRLNQLQRRRRRPQGYSLLELLLVTGMGLLLVTVVLSVIDGHVRSRTSMEALMRLQDHWSRVQFLLEQDIQESQGMVATSNGCGSGSRQLTIQVPSDTPATPAYITYYLKTLSGGTELWRCGPAVKADGDLDFSTPSDALLVRRVGAFSVTTSSSDPQRISYSLTLTDPSGATYTNQAQPSGGMSRSRVIN
ncbi:MAG: hypothetical protein ACK5IA_17795 [Cyanobacteriota bacterium]